MQLNFWGVRGSLPTPDRHSWRYGGNTPCLEIRAGNQIFIFDAGTGIRQLGHQLRSEFDSGLEAHLFLTHYHWDHIQGLPFFEPLYFAGNTTHIFGPHPQSDTLSTASLLGVLRELFRAPFFPVSLGQLKGNFILRELDSMSDLSLSDTRVRTCRVNHPQGSLAYRLDHCGASLVYITDHEPGRPEFDQALRQFARGADLLVSDAQYRPEELRAEKAGWGHGSWRASVDLARDAEVKNLVLFHHEPMRTDSELDQYLSRARQAFPNTWTAAEGMLIEITSKEIRVGSHDGRFGQRTLLDLPVQVLTRHNGSPLPQEARLQSLSFYGAYFLSPQGYEPEQPVDLVLPLRANGNHPSKSNGHEKLPGEAAEFCLRGYVLHSEPLASDDGLVGVAVYFPANRGAGALQPAHQPLSASSGDAGLGLGRKVLLGEEESAA